MYCALRTTPLTTHTARRARRAHGLLALELRVVKPARGCAVTFPPRIEHEGVTISAGSRHLVCIFPDLVPATKPAHEKERTRDLQRHAALVVFGRLKKQKT